MFLNLFAYGKYKSYDDLESCIQYCLRYISEKDFSLCYLNNEYVVFEKSECVGYISCE